MTDKDAMDLTTEAGRFKLQTQFYRKRFLGLLFLVSTLFMAFCWMASWAAAEAGKVEKLQTTLETCKKGSGACIQMYEDVKKERDECLHTQETLLKNMQTGGCGDLYR